MENPYRDIIAMREEDLRQMVEGRQILEKILINQLLGNLDMLKIRDIKDFHAPYLNVEIPEYLDWLDGYDRFPSNKKERRENLKKIVGELNSLADRIRELNREIEKNRRYSRYFDTLSNIKDKQAVDSIMSILQDMTEDPEIYDGLMDHIDEIKSSNSVGGK